MALRLFLLLLLLLAQVPSASASPIEEYRLDDPLARRLVCTGWHESGMYGPGYSLVSIFAVPETDGKGERLYVGLADDIWDRDSSVRLWRGPVAARWSKLRPGPGYVSKIGAPNPARYRVDALYVLSGGRGQTLVMNVDLTSGVARVQPENPRQELPGAAASEVLEEIPVTNESLRLVARLYRQETYQAQTLSLYSYRVWLGEGAPPSDRLKPRYEWHKRLNTHLLAVSAQGDPTRSSVRFLPLRPGGWDDEGLWAKPDGHGADEVFILRMVSRYLAPRDDGQLQETGVRYKVSIGLDVYSITTLETGLEYNTGAEKWEKAVPQGKGRRFPSRPGRQRSD